MTERHRALRLDVATGDNGRRRLAPTDISTFIQQGSCQRYLRLTMVDGNRTSGVPDPMRQYGVRDQGLTPLLSQTGRRFEEEVERAIAANPLLSTQHVGQADTASRLDDNALFLRAARGLASGAARVLFQVRLRAPVGEWDMRGDTDLLLLRRDASGRLSVLVADIKSSTKPKLEHQLQIAFYARMLESILAGDAQAHDPIRLAVLYRAPEQDRLALEPELALRVAADRDAARKELGTSFACLAVVSDPDALADTVDDLVAGASSLAGTVATEPFEAVPYHLADVCDGCRFNAFCMKWSAEHDDLSLIPFITAVEKRQLHRAGITTVAGLAALKRLVPRPDGEAGPPWRIVPEPAHYETLRGLATRPPVGPRLDELVVRAQAYRRDRGDDYPQVFDVPGGGSGSLPEVTPERHANMVWLYVDAQTDYVNDRLYLLAARVVACEAGVPVREASVIEMTDGPPDDPLTERRLIGDWAGGVLRTVTEVAAPDPETGGRRAPIHVVFFSGQETSALLNGLSRHLEEVFGATALYDFVTQTAAYDSPFVTGIADEIRNRRNLPLIAQSLVRTASFLGFDWNTPRPFRQLFRERTFDYFGRLDGADDRPGDWFMSRARFRSGIPLEYAYGLWGELDDRPTGGRDTVEPYLAPSLEEFRAYVDRRLDALAFLAGTLRPNREAGKTAFDLPDLGTFEARAHGLGEALLEFLQVERHVELAEWRRIRQSPPERRMTAGQSWVMSFHDEDQTSATRVRVAEARSRHDEIRARTAGGAKLTAAERRDLDLNWSLAAHPLRFRVSTPDDADPGLVRELVAMSDLGVGDWGVLSPRLTTNDQLPVEQRQPFTPTAKQLLYAPRVTIDRLAARDDGGAWLDLTMLDQRGGQSKGLYSFGGRPAPPRDGETYTLDANPDDFSGSGLHQTIQQIVDGRPNALFDRLAAKEPAPAAWPDAAVAGQARFLSGLVALHEAGPLHDFEEAKHAFIGEAAREPFLLVQGPPGTGKSYTTAFAVFARVQGAMAADMDFRVVASCKTHAATDVLRDGFETARTMLRTWSVDHPDLFADHFDERLLDLPILRMEPSGAQPDGVEAIWRKKYADRAADGDRIGLGGLTHDTYLILCTTPGGIRAIDEEQGGRKVANRVRPVHCVVLDEASQMNLPEAIMACRLLDPAGQIVVVGDHRQMAPIVRHDWDGERRRTFQEYAAYASLFDTLRARVPAPRTIRFARSFRLHAEMAEFLRQEVYRHDGIAYYSTRFDTLAPDERDDAFVRAVLEPDHPLIVVTHGERDSQTRNDFEVALMAPVLRALAAALDGDIRTGLGVVVPHTAQRAAFQAAVPELTMVLDDGKALTAVDTVEKFQGGERTAMVFAATESDSGYLATRADFLYDPRRLTVAMSRAKRKMILVASQTVFTHFSPDEETFANVLLWKNLLRRTCTVPLWRGELGGQPVTVWGNAPVMVPDANEAVEAGVS